MVRGFHVNVMNSVEDSMASGFEVIQRGGTWCHTSNRVGAPVAMAST